MNPTKENFSVSAKLMGGEEAEAVVEMMQQKNPRLAVVGNGSYWSVTADKENLVFDMGEISEALGHPYTVSNFLVILASYKGEIEVRDASVVIKEFAPVALATAGGQS